MKAKIDTGFAAFLCPGCDRPHVIPVDVQNQNNWGWNRSIESPTFTPSILARYTHPKGYSNDNPAPKDFAGEFVTDVCHSYVTDGRIQFLNDCTHHLVGQTVELPDYEEWENRDD